MPSKDWLRILLECKSQVQRQTSPLLDTLQTQPSNLGVGAGGDQIRQIDLVAESAITATLVKNHVSFTLISEESGIREYGTAPGQAYVTTDPIDGTTNLTRGIPFYATSIAVSTAPTLETVHTALVTDLVHNQTYTAQRGKGAKCNNTSIAPSENTSLEEAVIGVDINTFKIDELVPKFIGIIKRTKHLRHLGANALELCYVADATTDAFIDLRGKLRTTDMAAGSLIIKEAGAKMTTPEDKALNVRLDPKQKVSFIATGNTQLHKTLLDLVAGKKETK